MNNNKFVWFCIVLFVAVSISSCSKKITYLPPTSLSQEYISTLSNRKQIALEFVKNIDPQKNDLDKLLMNDFYSHDKNWEGPKADYFNKRNSVNSLGFIKPIRIIQDDSLVAVHSRVLGDTLKFRWDIIKFNQNKIQEHWSNVQDSLRLNPDGHSEIDGPTIPEQLEKTDDNRALIARFMDQCMIREAGGASKFFNFGLYIQHNRDVGDGINGLLWAMLKMKRAGHVIKFKHNYRVMAEGNLVLSATEGYVGDEKTTFYDFFRIEKNKIVEHWDIIAPVDKFIYFKPSQN